MFPVNLAYFLQYLESAQNSRKQIGTESRFVGIDFTQYFFTLQGAVISL